MKNNFKFFLIVIGTLLLVTGCGSTEEAGTANGQSVNDNNSTDENTDQLVATTIALVEIMDQLELDLVGVPTSYKELPSRYAEATEVGMAAEPDMEIIKSLQPTDVLSATTLDAEFDLAPTFAQADVPVTFVDMESIEGMYETVLELGEKYNRQEQAEQISQAFDNKIEEVAAKTEGKEAPNVLILLGIPGSYLVATENSYLGDLVARAGGVNAFPGEDDIEYMSANTEHLQQTNPDIILRAAHGMPIEVVKMFDKEFAENDIWQHFKAVQDDRVYDLEETLFGTTANLAAPEALEELVHILFPDL